jgi:hypothetical protein
VIEAVAGIDFFKGMNVDEDMDTLETWMANFSS